MTDDDASTNERCNESLLEQRAAALRACNPDGGDGGSEEGPDERCLSRDRRVGPDR